MGLNPPLAIGMILLNTHVGIAVLFFLKTGERAQTINLDVNFVANIEADSPVCYTVRWS